MVRCNIDAKRLLREDTVVFHNRRAEMQQEIQQPRQVLSLIGAVATNGVIGKGGKLPWSIPSDGKRFKDITDGHPVIMGRATWESLPLPVRPLPGRANIVMTRQPGFRPLYRSQGAIVVSSVEEALLVAERIPDAGEAFVIGGEEIYRQFLPFAKRMYITKVHTEAEGDAFFPELGDEWKCIDAMKAWRWLKVDSHETSFHIYERVSA